MDLLVDGRQICLERLVGGGEHLGAKPDNDPSEKSQLPGQERSLELTFPSFPS